MNSQYTGYAAPISCPCFITSRKSAFPPSAHRTIADGRHASQFATERCIRYRLQIGEIGRSVSLHWITNIHQTPLNHPTQSCSVAFLRSATKEHQLSLDCVVYVYKIKFFQRESVLFHTRDQVW